MAGMLNSVGLPTPASAVARQRAARARRTSGPRVVASIWGVTVDDYRRAAELLARGRPVGRVAWSPSRSTVSCPNIEDRRRMFAHARPAQRRGDRGDARPRGRPLWAKLSPERDRPHRDRRSRLSTPGPRRLTLVNTLMGLALDPVTGRPRLGAGGGGLSGPALHPVAVRAVYDVPPGLSRPARSSGSAASPRASTRGRAAGRRRDGRPGRHRHLRPTVGDHRRAARPGTLVSTSRCDRRGRPDRRRA